MFARTLISATFLGVAPVVFPATPQDSKIDAGLDGAAKFFPVFVRMSDQLFGGAGDYENFL